MSLALILAAADAASHEGGGAALPQFDPAIFPGLLFWLFVSFVALYLVMARSALPRIATVLEERRDRIADDLDSAQEMKRKAEAIRRAHHESLSTARANSAKTLQEARAKAAEESERRRAKMEAEVAAKLDAARTRIDKAKSAALTELEQTAADAAADIVGKLTPVSATADEARAAVTEAVKSHA